MAEPPGRVTTRPGELHKNRDMPDWGSPVIAPEPISGVTLRPHAPIIKQWSVAVLAFVAPIFVALYWLTVPDGRWPLVLAMHLAFTAIAAAGLVSYSLVSVTAGPEGLRRRDALGRRRTFPSDAIGRLLHVPLSRNGSAAVQPQVFVLGTDGRLLTRLHAAFWSVEGLDSVLAALALPAAIEAIEEPMTLAQFDRAWPGLLHRLEVRFLTVADDDDDVLPAPAP